MTRSYIEAVTKITSEYFTTLRITLTQTGRQTGKMLFLAKEVGACVLTCLKLNKINVIPLQMTSSNSRSTSPAATSHHHQHHTCQEAFSLCRLH
jgi:hypothetical protein